MVLEHSVNKFAMHGAFFSHLQPTPGTSVVSWTRRRRHLQHKGVALPLVLQLGRRATVNLMAVPNMLLRYTIIHYIRV